jgi:post-segregation antitoxin (ccd killing protein)
MRKKTLIRQLAVSVSEETWKKILESTNEAEVNISEWIRDAIEARLAKEARHNWLTKEQPKEDH